MFVIAEVIESFNLYGKIIVLEDFLLCSVNKSGSRPFDVAFYGEANELTAVDFYRLMTMMNDHDSLAIV